MFGLFRKDFSRRTGDASLREHLSSALFRLRRLRDTSPERRPLRHQTRPAVLSNRLRKRSRNASRLRARYIESLRVVRKTIFLFAIYIFQVILFATI